MTTAIRAVADAHVSALTRLDPEAAVALGRCDVDRIPDLSPEAYAERDALARRTVGELARATDEPTTPADRILAAALTERLTADSALYEAGFTTTLLAPLATPVHQLRLIFDDLPTAAADTEVVVRHLAGVPGALRQYGRTLQSARRAGHRISRRQALLLAAQCEAWVDPRGADVFRRLPAVSQGGDRATRAADEAGAAMSAFAAFLRTELTDERTRAEDTGVGAELYAITSQAFLGAPVDCAELYAWGWDELARLGREARTLAADITGHTDLADALAALDADPRRRIATGRPLLEWLQTRLDELTDALDGRHFDLPPGLRNVEARLDAADSGVMYYTPPELGLARPGRVWWAVPAGVEHVSTWREVSSVHHEGLPGHHLQFAVTLGNEHLHPWQRHLCHVHGYAEGWAHYAEQLAVELGLLDDPAERLGMIYAQVWRAARIVVDIGLHLDLPIPAANGVVDAGRWSPEIAARFLHEVSGLHPSTARFEVDRYLGWPGQALAFKVGARLWQQIRTETEERLAGAFDLKQFHMNALNLGPMGLAPLRQTFRDGRSHLTTPPPHPTSAEPHPPERATTDPRSAT
ncbi:DUF885 domain-containing protein [Streptomyces sp. SID3343]|uniref:DUF885 family protein n=1 Tax=Streptomyces sp. SID3343 TaxID=2690260 RepID=UPI0019266A25